MLSTWHLPYPYLCEDVSIYTVGDTRPLSDAQGREVRVLPQGRESSRRAGWTSIRQFLDEVRYGLGCGIEYKPMPVVLYTNEARDAAAHWQPPRVACAGAGQCTVGDAQLVDVDGVSGWLIGPGKTAGSMDSRCQGYQEFALAASAYTGGARTA